MPARCVGMPPVRFADAHRGGDHRFPAGAQDPASPHQDRQGPARVRSGLLELSLIPPSRPAIGLPPLALTIPQLAFMIPRSCLYPSRAPGPNRRAIERPNLEFGHYDFSQALFLSPLLSEGTFSYSLSFFSNSRCSIQRNSSPVRSIRLMMLQTFRIRAMRARPQPRLSVSFTVDMAGHAFASARLHSRN